ncbi:ABC transporter substrate-binding protein [Kaistia algarum]|uniref:glycine betaine ABC transporter substrate-binding protein OsmF n=1 Tax=Kaistia algarum TaxID=2083279 RepID=UPI000CE8644B|nr:ABC transporter substrate-binding protein [Kaistia algarum]MCX5515533.1 ABC transporter substrate-binding protein [Kaistia algarum]PPE81065.1 ABC transporter substrate-binding protein [Kaistia algarum]
MSPFISRRTLLAAAITLAAGLPLAIPSATFAAEPVKVGSKIDTEGSLLGNIIIAVLDANGIPTVNKVSLGNTKIVRGAITAGEIDIYPEYTGNGAFFFSVDSDPVWKNAKEGYEKVKQLDFDANKIVWLTPAPADNTWVIAIRKDVADANQLASLEQFATWINGGGTFKMAASAEFVESPAALPAFQTAYGFKLGSDQIVTLAGGDTTTFIKAAAEQTSGVNGSLAYGTDGALAALGLIALADDKGVQPVYAPAPIIREAVLKDYPQIADLLAPVFQTLDGPALQSLNAKIAVDGLDPKQVATDYLKSKGLLK